jgi:hypothetical protein
VDTEISHVDATVENRLNAVLESMFGEDFEPEVAPVIPTKPVQKSELEE